MYRGIPSKDQFLNLSKEDQDRLITSETSDLEISKIKWTFNDFDAPTWAKITTQIEFENKILSRARSIVVVSELEGKLRKGFLKLSQYRIF